MWDTVFQQLHKKNISYVQEPLNYIKQFFKVMYLNLTREVIGTNGIFSVFDKLG